MSSASQPSACFHAGVSGISHAVNLRCLHLHHNLLVHFGGVGGFPSVTALTALEEIRLDNNHLIRLPPELGALRRDARGISGLGRPVLSTLRDHMSVCLSVCLSVCTYTHTHTHSLSHIRIRAGTERTARPAPRVQQLAASAHRTGLPLWHWYVLYVLVRACMHACMQARTVMHALLCRTHITCSPLAHSRQVHHACRSGPRGPLPLAARRRWAGDFSSSSSARTSPLVWAEGRSRQACHVAEHVPCHKLARGRIERQIHTHCRHARGICMYVCMYV